MKVLVTGSLGLVGSAVQHILNQDNKYQPLFTTHYDYDLRKEDQVIKMFHDLQPNYIIHCAAVVGGVKFNKQCPDILFRNNLLMNTHMIHYAKIFNIKKLIAFSSACAFQDGVYPFKEDNLQDGKPYEGNLAYGYAKRMVDIQIQIYNKLHNRKDITVIPVSIYGPNDCFDLENGHFIPSLIHKTFEAKRNKTSLILWGDGTPLRELIFSHDLAKVLVDLLDRDIPYDKLLATSGQEVSIKEMAETICDLMGFTGKIEWDTTKPNGQHRKPTDPTRFKEVIGKNFQFTPYREGLKQTIQDFVGSGGGAGAKTVSEL
jgi:GDP-L-fucose synthase